MRVKNLPPFARDCTYIVCEGYPENPVYFLATDNASLADFAARHCHGFTLHRDDLND